MPEKKQRFVDNNNGTITDSLTELMWQEGYAYRETGNYINWYNAKVYVEKLNEQQLGGHSDWRLPNKLEIQSIYEVAHSFLSRGKTFILHIDPIFEFGYGSCFGLDAQDFPLLLGSNLMLETLTGILRVVCLEQCEPSD